MPGRRGKNVEVARRRQQVAEYYITGWTQMAIAQELSVSQGTISLDLQWIQKEWRNSRIRNFDSARELELQKLDRLEREAWLAWERSQKPSQSAEFSDDAAAVPKRKKVKNQVGDPRFLVVVHQAIASRRALLGLDALPALPKENENDNPAERADRIATLVAQIRERERIAVARTTTLTIESGSVRSDSERGEMEDGEAPRLSGPCDS